MNKTALAYVSQVDDKFMMRAYSTYINSHMFFQSF